AQAGEQRLVKGWGGVAGFPRGGGGCGGLGGVAHARPPGGGGGGGPPRGGQAGGGGRGRGTRGGDGGRERGAGHGADASGRAGGGLPSRAAAEVLSGHQDVAGAEAPGERRVEVGEEPLGGIGRREDGEA